MPEDQLLKIKVDYYYHVSDRQELFRRARNFYFNAILWSCAILLVVMLDKQAILFALQGESLAQKGLTLIIETVEIQYLHLIGSIFILYLMITYQHRRIWNGIYKVSALQIAEDVRNHIRKRSGAEELASSFSLVGYEVLQLSDLDADFEAGGTKSKHPLRFASIMNAVILLISVIAFFSVSIFSAAKYATAGQASEIFGGAPLVTSLVFFVATLWFWRRGQYLTRKVKRRNVS